MPKTDHRVNLTATMVAKLPLATTGQQYQRMDSQVPGFGIRVTDKSRTYILRTRYPGERNAARRKLGDVGVISLADAREKARHWRKLVAEGKDPGQVAAAQKAAEIRKRALTFSTVVDDFIRDKVKTERNAYDVKLDIERDLKPKWKDRPVAEITDSDVAVIIKAKARTHFDKRANRNLGGPVAAKNLFTLVKRFFAWAMAQPEYRLSVSPCANLSASKLIGETPVSRDRILSDAEIKAFWLATGKLLSPYQQAYRLILLTALRKNELAGAQRDEIDIDKREWIIAADRMKGSDKGKRQSRPHLVPLTADMVTMLEKLPETTGNFVLSTTHGEKQLHLGTKSKSQLDLQMKEILGDNFKPFTVHDLRRTARSKFSELGISDAVAEAIIAHRRPGIVGVYDRHSYAAEKRMALERWGRHIQELVEPRESAQVIKLRG